VIAIVSAIIFTFGWILDHFLQTKDNVVDGVGNSKRIRIILVITVLVLAWVLALVQFKMEETTDKQMAYLTNQVTLAHIALTNSTATVKGLSIGGDSRAEVGWFPSADQNSLDFVMITKGDYPLRSLGIKITDETKRIHTDFGTATNQTPEGETVFQRFFGDVSTRTSADLCTIRFDPSITNYLRFDVGALNGSYWQILGFLKTNDLWAGRLYYKWGRFGDKVEVDPPEMRGKFLIY
jgi:hypothetical protein